VGSLPHNCSKIKKTPPALFVLINMERVTGILNIPIQQRAFGSPLRKMLTRVLISPFMEAYTDGRTHARGFSPATAQQQKNAFRRYLFLFMERVMGILNIPIQQRAFGSPLRKMLTRVLISPFMEACTDGRTHARGFSPAQPLQNKKNATGVVCFN
jgi:hypothetical protein